MEHLQRRRWLVVSGLAAILPAALAGCGKRRPSGRMLPSEARVLALGDSLTFGYGATPPESWPAQLAGITGWQIDNAGVNGDTSAGALQRLPGLLAAQRYDAILVGIGGNDMLRGVAVDATRANVAEILRLALAHTPHVALIATPAPEALRAAMGSLSDAPFYAEVSEAEKVLLLPGVYSSVLSDAALRSDRIHANAKGYGQMAQALADKLKEAGWR